MADFFNENFIQINGKYINKNHIVLVREDREDNQVYVALSNGDQLWFHGTLDQLVEKMGAYDTFKDKLPAEPERYEVGRQEYYDIMRNCTVVRIKYSDGSFEEIDSMPDTLRSV
jgi:hypothetical protein